MVTDFAARRLVYHTGGMPGARSAFARFPDEGLTIILLMNLDDVDIGALMFGVARLYDPVTPEIDSLGWNDASLVFMEPFYVVGPFM